MRLFWIAALALMSSACGAGPLPAAFGPYHAGVDGGSAPETQLPSIVAGGFETPFGIALAGQTLYLTDRAAGELLSVPLAGGTPKVVADDLGDPTWLATAGTNLFLVDAAGRRVLRATPAGVVTAIGSGLVVPGRIVAGGGRIFWLDQGTSGGLGVIYSAPDDGSGSALLAGLVFPQDIAYLGGKLYISERGRLVSCTSGAVYGSDRPRVSVIPATGGTPTVLYTAAKWEDGYPAGLAVDAEGQDVYFTQPQFCSGAGAVAKVAVSDGTATLLSDAPPGARRIEVGDADAVFASGQNLSITPIGGGPYQDIAVMTAVGDFLITHGRLYWTDQLAGEVLSMPLPGES